MSKIETAVIEMDGTVSIIASEQAQTRKLRRVKSARKDSLLVRYASVAHFDDLVAHSVPIDLRALKALS